MPSRKFVNWPATDGDVLVVTAGDDAGVDVLVVTDDAEEDVLAGPLEVHAASAKAAVVTHSTDR